MPSIALKRINKEIENYNAKAYLATSESVGFTKHLLNYDIAYQTNYCCRMHIYIFI
jgi:hypothetical protein